MCEWLFLVLRHERVCVCVLVEACVSLYVCVCTLVFRDLFHYFIYFLINVIRKHLQLLMLFYLIKEKLSTSCSTFFFARFFSRFYVEWSIQSRFNANKTKNRVGSSCFGRQFLGPPNTKNRMCLYAVNKAKQSNRFQINQRWFCF